MTVNEVALHLGVTHQRVRQLIKAGRLIARYRKGRVVITRHALAALVIHKPGRPIAVDRPPRLRANED